MAETYDLIVLGAGPGGYVAAIRASQLGMRVAVVERDKLGGVCLNKGCVPSKALLRSAEVYHLLRYATEYGVVTRDIGLDFTKVQARKNETVAQLHQGVQQLLQKHRVAVIQGTGRLMGPSIFSPQAGTVSVEQPDGGNMSIVSKYVMIATGSRPRHLPGLPVDGTRILHSDHALNLECLPSSIAIVGGGAIGVEWASMLNDFGVKVTVIETRGRLLPFEDEDISQEITRLLEKRDVTVLTGTNVLTDTVQIHRDVVSLPVQQRDQKWTLNVDQVLLATGRQANTDDIGLSNTDIQVDENGMIDVNVSMQTKESHIYAIGDIIGGFQLAHAASREGVIAVEHMAGLDPYPIEDRHIPRCTYCRPEVASIGLTEHEAGKYGYDVKVSKVPFRSIGKAVVSGDTDGFVKMVSNDKTDDLLGVHMIGPRATDLISEAGLATFLDATPWELSQVVHPHPTLSEIMGDAASVIGLDHG